MCEDRDTLSAIAFYDRCADTGIAVQHNLYGSRDLAVMAEILRKGLIKGERLQLLYVLERHSENKQSSPADIDPFVAWMRVNCPYAQWTACALGECKTECLVAAPPKQGRMHVGLANSFWNADGTITSSSAEHVAELSVLTTKNR